MHPMRRRRSLAPVVLGLAVALAGCSAETSTEPTVSEPASPQEAAVEWVEPAPTPTEDAAEASRLVFEVRTIAVTDVGWSAEVAIRNESDIAWEIDETVPSRFGVMLFASGELDELEQRNADRTLPGLRPAREFDPPLPGRLEPGAIWEGTIAAPGALAAERYLRVVFGPLFADGDPPQGLPPQLVWITDNAYRLRP
jgi:hypothetical protein